MTGEACYHCGDVRPNIPKMKVGRFGPPYLQGRYQCENVTACNARRAKANAKAEQ